MSQRRPMWTAPGARQRRPVWTAPGARCEAQVQSRPHRQDQQSAGEPAIRSIAQSNITARCTPAYAGLGGNLAVERDTKTCSRLGNNPAADRVPGTSFVGGGVVAGFTLLEVLVALAVIALTLGALIGLTGNQAASLDRQRERLYAEWVAANVLTELRLREPFPETGAREGRTDMGGRPFRWRLTIGATQEPSMRRLELQVLRGTDASPVVSFSAFAGSRQ